MASLEDRDRLLQSTTSDQHHQYYEPQSHSIVELQLDLRSDSNFRHSTEALRHRARSSSIRHVAITCHGSFFASRWNAPTVEEERELREFFQAIGDLINLQSLSLVSGSYGSPVLFPAALLVELLQRSIRLERLKVHGLCLQLEESSALREKTLQQLTRAFQYNTTRLSEVSFIRSFFGSESMEESRYQECAFQRLLSVWTTALPQLEQLSIHHRRHMVLVYAGSKLTKSVVHQVAASRTLKQLELFNFKLFDDHLEALAEGITAAGSHSCLQELSLSCKSFGLRACKAMAKVLSNNNSSLESLYIEPEKRVYSCGKHLNAECTNLLADALTSNVSLKSFTLEGLPLVSLEAFCKMMRHNLRLETLDVTGFQSNQLWEQDLDTHLLLNRVGRFALLHDASRTATRAQWVDAMIDVEGNVHALFYLLSANPSLCGNQDR